MSAAHEIVLDAHVHVHPCFGTAAFLDAAARNLRRGAAELGVGETALCGLLFTESREADVFGAWCRAAAGAPRPDANHGPWRFRAVTEDNSLWAERGAPDVTRLLIVAGRQLVTAEGLEVLGLGLREVLADGMALKAAVASVRRSGAVPVVPWGFGKWWASRGRHVRELLAGDPDGPLFLGDNAGRPRLAPAPRLFAEAARCGVFVLPGSDPLPFARQAGKAGSCGFRLSLRLDEERPAAAVLDALRRCRHQPATFGRRSGLLRFGRDQIAMQWRKRAGGAAPAADRGPA